MPETDAERGPAGVPPPPSLPEVESPPRDEVLDAVPSTEDVVQDAQPAEEIVNEQPSVEELLGEKRRPD